MQFLVFHDGFAIQLVAAFFERIDQPLHAGWLDGNPGVRAAGEGAMDNGRLLLILQFDLTLLGVDVAADASVCLVVEEDDGCLFSNFSELNFIVSLDRVKTPMFRNFS